MGGTASVALEEHSSGPVGFVILLYYALLGYRVGGNDKG